MTQTLRCPVADVNWQATVGGISRDTLLDIGLCVSWDQRHPLAVRITGKKGQMTKFFEQHECTVWEEMEPVQVTYGRSSDAYAVERF